MLFHTLIQSLFIEIYIYMAGDINILPAILEGTQFSQIIPCSFYRRQIRIHTQLQMVVVTYAAVYSSETSISSATSFAVSSLFSSYQFCARIHAFSRSFTSSWLSLTQSVFASTRQQE